MFRRATVLFAIAATMNIGCNRTNNLANVRSQLQMLESALQQYYSDFKDYPVALEDMVRPVQTRSGRTYGPYLAANPVDPWGHAYVYRRPATSTENPIVLSTGPDGREGTADDVRAMR
jgi:general secretion pathway protein G